MTGNGQVDGLPWWFKFWFPLAPEELVQPINPGWTFGNVIINEENSSAPDTERQIVSKDSYGRQLGKLLDATHKLIEQQGGAKNVEEYKQVLELWKSVKATKDRAAARRIQQLRQDLERLAATDEPAFREEIEKLRALVFAEEPPRSRRSV